MSPLERKGAIMPLTLNKVVIHPLLAAELNYVANRLKQLTNQEQKKLYDGLQGSLGNPEYLTTASALFNILISNANRKNLTRYMKRVLGSSAVSEHLASYPFVHTHDKMFFFASFFSQHLLPIRDKFRVCTINLKKMEVVGLKTHHSWKYRIVRKFEINFSQMRKLVAWLKEHDETCPFADPKKQGAIGGRLTYAFTPNSLGIVEKVICGCGKEVDLTTYDW